MNTVKKKSDSARIKAKIKETQNAPNQKKVTDTFTATYQLKKRNGNWKVEDMLNASGKRVYENLNLIEQKRRDDSYLRTERQYHKKVDQFVDRMTKMYRAKQSAMKAVSDIIPSKRVIDFTIDTYKNNTNQYLISLTYYFSDTALADNYLEVSKDSTQIFQEVFPQSSKIRRVQITVKDKYKDDYGKTQERYLARTAMNRKTYERINWDDFEYQKLESVTEFGFYEDSFYKGLKELQSSLEDWQKISTTSGYSNIPTTACADAKQQCQEYGECETYRMMRSKNLC